MKILYSGYNYRNVDNFRPLLEVLAARGHAIGYCAFPHPDPAKNLELGEAPFQRLAFTPLNAFLTWPALSELREQVHRAVREFSPDVVLLDDILNYPSSALSTLVAEVAPSVPVVAFQHGFFQFWSHYRRFFACDVFLAYGERDRRQFLPHQQERVVTFGLPKLSRQKGVPLGDDGTVLYLAQDTPRWEVVAQALKTYAKISGRQVRVRLHPQHAQRYEALADEGLLLQYATDDITPHLAGCHAVVTTGSTAGMEALALGKPVVSLPGYSSSIFSDSPSMALDCTGEEIWRVLDEWPHRQHEVQSFLEDAISPLSFDMERAADLFEELVTRRSRRSAPSPEAALLAERERLLVAQQVRLEERNRTIAELRATVAEQAQAQARGEARTQALVAEAAGLHAQLEQQRAEERTLQESLQGLEGEVQAWREQAEASSAELEALRDLERARLTDEPPLRHRVADTLNTQLKRLGGLQERLKHVISTVSTLRSRQ